MVAYYQVKLYAYDDVIPGVLECVDSTLSVITVYPKVNPVITAEPESGCQPLSVLLTAQEGAAGYLWDFGDNLNENGSFAINHVYINLGEDVETYKTILYTTSAYGCVASDTIDIVVNPVPKPNLTAVPATQMETEAGGASVTFQNGTASGPWTFEFDFGDGTTNVITSNLNDVVHQYAAPGVYTVTLYSNIGDCRDSAKTAITITPLPPVALFHSITEGCHPLEVQFFNTSTHATNFTWQFGDGSISTQENPIHTFYEPSTFTVKLLASGLGGSDQTSSDIQVNATPQVFFTYAPDSVFVNDKDVRFFNLTSYADRYYWDFGDINETPLVGGVNVSPNNTSTLPDPVHQYMFEGWKDVLLIAENDYCIDSLFIPMAIKVIPAGALKFPDIFRPGNSPTGGNIDNLLDPQARNSVFFPGVNKQVLEYNLYIYNRWGQLIFHSTDINIGWDGFINDTKAAQGVYIWKVSGVYSNNSPFSDAGDVTLVWQ